MAPIRKKRQPMRRRVEAPQKPATLPTSDCEAAQRRLPAHLAPPKPGMDRNPYERNQRLPRQGRRSLLAPQDRGITKSPSTPAGKKRRRPGKKLLAAEDMDGMRDALPDIHDNGEGDEWEGFSEEDAGAQANMKRRRRRTKVSDGKIQMRSLKHRPGAMKRKRIMEGVEMERFARNLAQLSANAKGRGEESGGDAGSGAGSDGTGGASAGEKWAALRAFIGSTMERKDGFGERR